MCEQTLQAPRRHARSIEARTAGRVAAGLGLVAALLLGGCDSDVFNPAGDVALQQRNLILVSTALMLLIIVPVLVLTVVFAWRYRAGNDKAEYDPKFTHSTVLELVVWTCPLLIIMCLGAITWTSTHLLDPYRPLERLAAGRPVPAGTKPLDVQVVALDWKWLFIYPEQNVATINDLVLPIDRPVRFSITSNDQMNTFFAPTMAGMIYAMPGMQTTLHAVLNRKVESEGMSANYTGAGFSGMRFAIRGVDAAAFEDWVGRIRSGSLHGPAQASVKLTPALYADLAKPSEDVPQAYFPSVESGLFERAVNQCVQPGRPCAAHTMAADERTNAGANAGAGHGAHGMSMPPATASSPQPANDPVPALMKAPEDKGSGPNVSAPVRPSVPGQPATNN